MEERKSELEELRLAVARLETEVQRLRGEVARAPAQTIGGGDDEGGGYDPWVKTYGGGDTSIEGTETGSDAASGALKVCSAADSRGRQLSPKATTKAKTTLRIPVTPVQTPATPTIPSLRKQSPV